MNPTSKSPRSLLRSLAPLALLLLASANLYAQQPMLPSQKGAAEAPSVTASAKVTGQITVLPDHTVRGSIKISGLVPTVAHIREASAGKGGPAIITLTKTANDTFAIPPDTKLSETQYSSYMAGDLYVSVYSAEIPNGEIRAKLLRT